MRVAKSQVSSLFFVANIYLKITLEVLGKTPAEIITNWVYRSEISIDSSFKNSDEYRDLEYKADFIELYFMILGILMAIKPFFDPFVSCQLLKDLNYFWSLLLRPFPRFRNNLLLSS
jgi:hypothetical protein